MACKLVSGITNENCEYQVAGVKSVYLINFDSANQWKYDDNGQIETITLADNTEKAYKLTAIDNTASWTDDLAVNGNGGKYRTHTVNFTLGDYSYNLIKQEKAMSIGKFTAIVVDKSGRCVVLGRNNGLSATSFNYASGAADADANGWTTVLAGTESEVGQLLASEAVVKALEAATVPNGQMQIID